MDTWHATTESKTQKQHECQQWFEERKSRLTASTFGSIIKREKKSEKKLLKIFLIRKMLHPVQLPMEIRMQNQQYQIISPNLVTKCMTVDWL